MSPALRRGATGLALVGGGEAGRPLLAHVERQMREAAREQAYERATWLRRRGERLGELLERLGSAVEAMHARPRLVLAEHPDGERADAVFLVGGRIVDWGEARGPDDLSARTRRALGHVPRPTEVPSLTAEEAAAAEGLACSSAMREGDPAEVIVGLAARHKADLLVVGNVGMNRRLLGSVPNTVTHKATCSVLLVKTS